MESCVEVFNLKECLIFLEDILVYSELITGHLIRMEAAFSRLKENCFKLKLSISEMFKTSEKYSGHVVSHEGIKTDFVVFVCLV